MPEGRCSPAARPAACRTGSETCHSKTSCRSKFGPPALRHARTSRSPAFTTRASTLPHSWSRGTAWVGASGTLQADAGRGFQATVSLWRRRGGLFDESDPAWSSREAATAADAGIDAWIFDWYWYCGVEIWNEALDRGFLQGCQPGAHEVRHHVGQPYLAEQPSRVPHGIPP